MLEIFSKSASIHGRRNRIKLQTEGPLSEPLNIQKVQNPPRKKSLLYFCLKRTVKRICNQWSPILERKWTDLDSTIWQDSAHIHPVETPQGLLIGWVQALYRDRTYGWHSSPFHGGCSDVGDVIFQMKHASFTGSCALHDDQSLLSTPFTSLEAILPRLSLWIKDKKTGSSPHGPSSHIAASPLPC